MLPFGNQGQPTLDIEEIRGCHSPHQFYRNYVWNHKPVVMRGCANDSPAVELWTDEYLVQQGKHWTGQHWGNETLSKYIQRYKTQGEKAQYTARDSMPLHLRRDIRVPAPLLCTRALSGELENIVLWFSDGGRSSRLHHDGCDALLTQLDGQKTITLVDPVDSPYLYADHHGTDHFGFSPIDLTSVDLERYPEAARALLHKTTIGQSIVLNSQVTSRNELSRGIFEG